MTATPGAWIEIVLLPCIVQVDFCMDIPPRKVEQQALQPCLPKPFELTSFSRALGRFWDPFVHQRGPKPGKAAGRRRTRHLFLSRTQSLACRGVNRP